MKKCHYARLRCIIPLIPPILFFVRLFVVHELLPITLSAVLALCFWAQYTFS